MLCTRSDNGNGNRSRKLNMETDTGPPLDHLPIIISWRKSVLREKGVRVITPNIGKTDWELFEEKLRADVWEVEREPDVKRKYAKLQETILNAIEAATTFREGSQGPKRWMNTKLKENQTLRYRAKRNLNINRDEWIAKKNEVKQLTREAKQESGGIHSKG